jgi:hypothetical protein
MVKTEETGFSSLESGRWCHLAAIPPERLVIPATARIQLIHSASLKVRGMDSCLSPLLP